MARNARRLSLYLFSFLATLASATPARAQTTALFFDSEPGDYIGQGVQRTYTPADGTFQINTFSSNAVGVTVTGPNFSFWWSLNFASATGLPLTVGTYESARRSSSATSNGQDVFGSGRGCNQSTGRFVVREVTRSPSGTVLAFAADFEQHCEDGAPGLFGAIRYNSTIGDLLPFGGNYPLYQLTITPHANGRVSGGGVDCGAGNSVCQVLLPDAAHVSITATPEVGYLFTGWTGSCRGTPTTSVHVNSQKTCAALFEPLVSSAPRTLFYWESQAGDFVGRGGQGVLSPAISQWSLTSWENGNSVDIYISDGTETWRLDFSAPEGSPLSVGYYGAARRYPVTPLNGLYVSGQGNGCSRITGRFTILEIVLGSDGTVQRFAADFEQHCEDAVPALFGIIRYNSTIDDVVPFGGAYPSYQLTVTPPVHGRITGGGVDCGTGGSVCQVPLATAARLTVTATPDLGYVFMGWTGDCQGDVTTSVHVNGPKACAALFEPLVSSSPRTVLYWDSQTGDSIGAGARAVYSPANSQWMVTSSSEGNRIDAAITDSTNYWRLTFSAPAGQPLTVGYYGAARTSWLTPFNGLDVSGSGHACTPTGRFVVLEIALGSNGTVQRFAADFEQHCGDGVPALFGAIRYNSTIDEVVPFGGAYPSYELLLTRPAHGRVTGTSVDCGGAASECRLTLGAAAQVVLTATPDFGYTFTGWTEDCSGGAVTTLHVNWPKRCAASFEPTVAVAPRTLLRWDSQAANYIGEGRSEVLSLVNSRWTAFHNANMVELKVDSVGPLSASYWTLRFQAPTGEALQAGRQYLGADDFAGPGVPSFVIFGNGRFCGGGEFTVREFSLATQNSVLRFAADFVLDCGSASGPLLTGSIQYNSTVDVAPTTLSVDPSSLRFASTHNGASVTLQPAPQSVRLTLSRADVGWTAAANQPWIQISPSSGTGSAAVTVGVNVLGGHPGTGSATGAVTITLTDGSGISQTINLTVTLYFTGATTPPFGLIDTPLPDRTGVTGSIPMTGWALDDVEVTGVTICRDAVAPEVPPVDANCGGTAQIFVGRAEFIEGARPDVQRAFPSYPRNDAGGWGFMVLTNTLPNQGNGTFVFSVYARDREGQVVRLGTRTMTCDNAHATAPFGTIDTPGQGEIVSGSSYVNFGWALTQQPKFIPFDGSTLMVYVDGQPVGSPSYNHPRVDVASTFPGLMNSNGPVGFRIIDTTTLSNGLHTIVWTATDSAGVTSGLGSRFFRVMNGASASVTEALAASASTAAVVPAEILALPLDTSPTIGRRSWAADMPWRAYSPGRTGRAVLRGEELDRFEIALGDWPGETYSGYLRVGEGLRPLPVGSHLDAQSGAFSWSPGVGFVGTYDLVFVRSNGGRAIARREVRFILQAKGSGHIGAQVVIDAPHSQQELAQPFALGGWAVDLDAASGPGIDTLHVWAYPLTGGAPVFLGTAGYGGLRQDVAAIHGDEFRDSGYGLQVQGLVPGQYDLAVFAWSNVSGAFVPGQVVRIGVR